MKGTHHKFSSLRYDDFFNNIIKKRIPLAITNVVVVNDENKLWKNCETKLLSVRHFWYFNNNYPKRRVKTTLYLCANMKKGNDFPKKRAICQKCWLVIHFQVVFAKNNSPGPDLCKNCLGSRIGFSKIFMKYTVIKTIKIDFNAGP